jgi:hypothetical protein
MLAISILLAGVVAPLILSSKAATPRMAASVGAIIGAAIVTKVNAAPLLIALLFLRSSKLIGIGGIACAGSILVLTLPVISQYPEMLKWFGAIVVNRGHYGEGGPGIPDAAKLVSNAWGILHSAPELLAIMVACLTSAALLRWWRPANYVTLSYALVVISAILAAQMLLVVKHFSPRYLVPSIGMACLANAILVSLVVRIDRMRAMAAITIAALLAAGTLRTAAETAEWQAERYHFLKAKAALLSRVAEAACLNVPYNESTDEFSLGYGNRWANSKFNKYLNQVQPNYLEYDFGAKSFVDSNGRIDMATAQERLTKAACVYFIGSPLGAGQSLPIDRSELSEVDRAENSNGTVVVYEWHRRNLPASP